MAANARLIPGADRLHADPKRTLGVLNGMCFDLGSAAVV
jgi:hypothetical protein